MKLEALVKDFLAGGKDVRETLTAEFKTLFLGRDGDEHREAFEKLIKGQRLADQYELEDLLERIDKGDAPAKPAVEGPAEEAFAVAASAPPNDSPAAPPAATPTSPEAEDRAALYATERAHLAEIRRDTKAAEAKYETSEDAEGRLAYAAALRQRDPEKAEAIAKTVVTELPDDPRPRCSVAWSQFMQRDLEGALTSVDEALALDENYPLAMALKALLTLLTGDVESAMAQGDRAVELVPDDPEVRMLRVIRSMMAGDARQGLRDLDHLVEAEPEVADWWEERAAMRSAAGDFGAARLDLNQALRLRPTPSGFARRGAVRYEEGDLSGAVEDYDEAMSSTDAMPPPVLANKGIALLRMGKREDALACLKEAFAADEQDPEVRVRLAHALLADGEHEEVLTLLAPMASGEQATITAVQLTARALLGLKRYAEAMEGFKLVAANVPDDVPAWLELGSCALEVPDLSIAAVAFERVLAGLPDGAGEAKQNLEAMLQDLRSGKVPALAFRAQVPVRIPAIML